MPNDLTLSDAHIRLSDGRAEFRLEVDKLSVAPGEAIALTGASGSGKTLLMELLGLLRRPDADAQYRCGLQGGFAGNLFDLWKNGPRNSKLAETRGRLFGFVPQTGGLLPFLTVAENVRVPQQINDLQDHTWCDDLLHQLDLADAAALYPAALSIGQRQRTAIARALAHRPAVVIADEPTSALDPARADAVLSLFLQVAQGQGCAVVLSSHDTARIDRFGLRTATLQVSAMPGGSGSISRLVGDTC